MVTKSVPDLGAGGLTRENKVTAGGDLKYRPASNLVLNATVNPDFGQVEADPSELNLTAFETFFDEKRPFFVEGKGLFTFTVNCVVVVDCSTGEGLFYSRRIGRYPQLAGENGDPPSAISTPIVGAAKMTGRLPNGFSLGLLDAVTDRVDGGGGTTLEPATNYAVVRANQDFHQGTGSVGFILTGVNRSLDPASAAYLHRSAYTGGVDGRWRFTPEYEVSSSFDLSRVAGDRRGDRADPAESGSPLPAPGRPAGVRLHPDLARRRQRRAPLRQGRRPPASLRDRLPESHTRLRDQRRRLPAPGRLPGMDHLGRAAFYTPNQVFQQLRWNFNNWEYWTAAGLPTERALNTNVHIQFTNRWWLHTGGTVGQLGPPTATAAPAAARRCGRIPTSRPGSPSKGTTVVRWCRRCRPISASPTRAAPRWSK